MTIARPATRRSWSLTTEARLCDIGNYMLFVVDSNGVPSVAKRVKLQLD